MPRRACITRRSEAVAPLMSADTLQILLAVIGWVVAFLLGKEMSTGYSLWRARRAEQRADETDPEGPRRA